MLYRSMAEPILDRPRVVASVRQRVAAAVTQHRMAGSRDEYIDLMAGVPQIADDFAASR